MECISYLARQLTVVHAFLLAVYFAVLFLVMLFKVESSGPNTSGATLEKLVLSRNSPLGPLGAAAFSHLGVATGGKLTVEVTAQSGSASTSSSSANAAQASSSSSSSLPSISTVGATGSAAPVNAEPLIDGSLADLSTIQESAKVAAAPQQEGKPEFDAQLSANTQVNARAPSSSSSSSTFGAAKKDLSMKVSWEPPTSNSKIEAAVASPSSSSFWSKFSLAPTASPRGITANTRTSGSSQRQLEDGGSSSQVSWAYWWVSAMGYLTAAVLFAGGLPLALAKWRARQVPL